MIYKIQTLFQTKNKSSRTIWTAFHWRMQSILVYSWSKYIYIHIFNIIFLLYLIIIFCVDVFIIVLWLDLLIFLPFLSLCFDCVRLQTEECNRNERTEERKKWNKYSIFKRCAHSAEKEQPIHKLALMQLSMFIFPQARSFSMIWRQTEENKLTRKLIRIETEEYNKETNIVVAFSRARCE